jgi:hypothetical protein
MNTICLRAAFLIIFTPAALHAQDSIPQRRINASKPDIALAENPGENTINHQDDINNITYLSFNEKRNDNVLFFNQYKKTHLIIPSIRPVSKKKSPYHAGIALQGIVTGKGHVPLWMRSNQYGSIPQDGISFSVIGHASKAYDTARNRKLLDWGAGFEGRANVGNRSEFLLTEGYVKARLSVIQFKAGRSKDIMGLTGDSVLSSGAFAISGNALGIPKVEISIPEYWTLPWTGKLLAVKGNFVHGWLGQQELLFQPSSVPKISTYFHQKSFYGRLGKPNWRLKLYGGFSHNVFFGNEQEIYGDRFKLSKSQVYSYVVFGKAYGARNVESSKIGNHLGSIDLGAEYNFDNLKIMVYRQNLYDVGALYYLANIKDGLNGITLTNNKPSQRNFQWKKLLVEFFYTRSQAGELDAKITPSGDEDYYNNYIYKEGWSYKGIGLGNPLLTRREYMQDGQVLKKNYEPFANNRVAAYHFGGMFSIFDWDIMTKFTYSTNYGSYAVSPEGNSLGIYRQVYGPPFFTQVNQFSGYLEAKKSLRKGYDIGIAAAIDAGKLLYNSQGVILKFSKNW